MTAYLDVLVGCLLIGCLFSMAGTFMMGALGVRTPLSASLRYSCWIAVAVLVAGKALAIST